MIDFNKPLETTCGKRARLAGQLSSGNYLVEVWCIAGGWCQYTVTPSGHGHFTIRNVPEPAKVNEPKATGQFDALQTEVGQWAMATFATASPSRMS